MSKPVKYSLLVLLCIICGFSLYNKYEDRRTEFERLADKGLRVPITAQLRTSGWGEMVSYTFTTKDGRQISDGRKSGNAFDQYKNASAIYNPDNPKEYELSFDFDSYSPLGSKIFFFLICLPAFVFVSYKFLSIGFKVFTTLWNHRSW